MRQTADQLQHIHHASVQEVLAEWLDTLNRHTTYRYKGIDSVNIGTSTVFHIRIIHFVARRDRWEALSRNPNADGIAVLDCGTAAMLNLIRLVETGQLIPASS